MYPLNAMFFGPGVYHVPEISLTQLFLWCHVAISLVFQGPRIAFWAVTWDMAYACFHHYKNMLPLTGLQEYGKDSLACLHILRFQPLSPIPDRLYPFGLLACSTTPCSWIMCAVVSMLNSTPWSRACFCSVSLP